MVMPTFSERIGNWYRLRELMPGLLHVNEPGHVSFFILLNKDISILIDSGLGISQAAYIELKRRFKLEKFAVLNTHAHCDHIGLNSFAKEVFMSPVEWLKYCHLSESSQLQNYRELMRDKISWPEDLEILNAGWKPTQNLLEGQIIQIDGRRIEAISTPGHTSGSFSFFSAELNTLFVGDLVYDGWLYLHFPDSSFRDYLASLEKIAERVRIESCVLLPSHNSIPLNESYLLKTIGTLRKIADGKLRPDGIEPKNVLFENGVRFIDDGVKVVLKEIEYATML